MKAAPRTIFFNLKPSFNVPVYDIGILSHDDIEAKSSKVCFSSRYALPVKPTLKLALTSDMHLV